MEHEPLHCENTVLLGHPVWGDFMFSVRFRRVRRRNNFCLSRQNRLS